MLVLAVVVAVITGKISLIHILFGLKDLGEGTRLLVSISEFLFFLSLLFILVKSKKNSPL
ncbi:hypothetical protein B2I21_17515 [Chryseobacterium mucoviscidosis]|uniref:hypothetical protein n=1 Tax=unclassified Paenibacillus TaxID=185978 RepID=UPI0009A34BA9|nr:hypothetical protein [Paenibacillus sp. 11B]MDN8593004.1 hypothetical protein [Paenibacillus sp. 11B]OPG96861.1 hypothetical protein B2I21_17515 [Chryseobacterium mucoviscidosis]